MSRGRCCEVLPSGIKPESALLWIGLGLTPGAAHIFSQLEMTASGISILVLWFRSPPTFPPAGAPVQDGIVIGDQTWTVWYGPDADGQNVVSYEAPIKRADGQAYDFNLKDFIDDAVERGYLNPSLNLIAIMGGLEIWGGAQGASITDFRAQVQ